MTVLLSLKDIREHPPSLNVSVASEIADSVNIQSSNDELNRETGVNVDNIDWDISVDSSQIDWDIGIVEETDDTGNGLGPYEMVNASEIIQCSLPNEAMESSHVPLDRDVNPPPEITVSDISWDISVETPQVDVIDDFSLPIVGSESPTYKNLTQTTETKEERSQLLDTEYRNKILDDLNEVHGSLWYLYLVMHFTS